MSSKISIFIYVALQPGLMAVASSNLAWRLAVVQLSDLKMINFTPNHIIAQYLYSIFQQHSS
ncbi:uncharacterized protein M421DRAFT_426604 [Didymella exigua CBS 183.55]|uniref:Uncharacterized protein n=1 Tax=Didymella exigua CBS 183.55 TaxID=1150837 RepID=A0A6A5R7J0_9PLEO|nr:uncharacterized protein M421DRAFT_426604 [Didymella exigua CBS 183.55]KAF1922676.1 hypothetical protein M421DRAFT_426604 [Didymella exigua CBS 183.55]